MAAAFLHFTQQTQLNRKEYMRQKAAKMQVIIWKVWKQPSMPDSPPQGTDFHWLYCCLLNHKGHWRPPLLSVKPQGPLETPTVVC